VRRHHLHESSLQKALNITMALKNGVDVKDVATMVGNSPEIIYRPDCGAKSGASFAGVLGVGEGDSF
jgi:hypothetical protein